MSEKEDELFDAMTYWREQCRYWKSIVMCLLMEKEDLKYIVNPETYIDSHNYKLNKEAKDNTIILRLMK